MSKNRAEPGAGLLGKVRKASEKSAAASSDLIKKHGPSVQRQVGEILTRLKERFSPAPTPATQAAQALPSTTAAISTDDPIPRVLPVMEGARAVPMHPPWCSYQRTADGAVELAFTCRRKFWWLWRATAPAGLVLSFAAPILVSVGHPGPQRQMIEAANQTLYFCLTLTVVLAVVFFAMATVRVFIRITEKAVAINDTLYDRRYFHGLSIGETFSQKNTGRSHHRIRILYGKWGYNTPWFLEDDEAVITMVWVAWVMRKFDEASVKKRAYDPARGVRDDGFS